MKKMAIEPLVYDLQELFRWLVDLSVIQLIEEKKLEKSDFIVTENYHIRLKENTARTLIDKIRINLNSFASYKGKNYSYQNILFDNMQQLANFVSDKNQDLTFNIPLIKTERNDSVIIRERILSMTPAERKRLGISKSSLWYQKKKIAERKKIRIYNKVLSKLV